MNKKIKKAVILLIWLGLWQITAIFVNNPIYFASPVETAAELFLKIRDTVFWASVGGSLLRILSGFITAFILAFLIAFASQRFKWLNEFISPFVTFLKSVPIAAVVVILLIWWGSRYLVLCISLMVVFPNIYSNMQTGLANADKGLIEAADVFKMRPVDKLLWIYRPAYLPCLYSAASVSLGMCFKSGIAAEIIGLPEFSAGERLYRDKIYLNTAGVFAWVIVILVLSSLTEHVLLYVLKQLSKIPPACMREHAAGDTGAKRSAAESYDRSGNDMHDTGEADERLSEEIPAGYTAYSDGITRSYDGRIIVDTAVKLKSGHVYYLKDPSGAGKTTLLNMIAGVTEPDSGSIHTGRIGMVFQDDRLVECANGLRNLKIAGCRGDLADELNKLLPDRTLMLPASELSGGERRRLAIARALLHPSDIVIMDEPFAGLDEETKHKTADWIMKHLDGRTLLYTSHETEPGSFPAAEELPLIDK